MPTVLDSFVLEIGMDPKNFTKGQQEAYDALKRTQDQALKGGKAIEESSKKSNEALGGIKTQALELFAVFTGGKGLIQFAQDTVRTNSQLGRLERNLNISASTMSKWQGVARIFGGDAATMAQTFTTITDAVEGFKIGAISPLIAEYRALSAAGGTVIDTNKGVPQLLLDIAANLAAVNAKNPALAGTLGRRLGLDPGFYDILVKGPRAVQEMLDKMAQLEPVTKKVTDAAGDLEQRWNNIGNKSDAFGRKILNAGAGGQIAEAADFMNLSPGEANAKFWSRESWSWLLGGSSKGGASAPAPSGGGDMAKYRASIAAIESRGSGGYAAVGPVTSSGDRAYGKYQIMGNNIGEWSQAALGKKIGIQEFMASPETQDKIFDYKFGQYVKQFGNPQDAASAWLTGKPLSKGANLRDLNGTSGADYASRFTKGLGGSSSTTEVNINGPININAGTGADGKKMAQDFTATLKAQSFAQQANQGGV